MDLLSLLGAGFGAGGLLVGLYQYRKQKEMEKRIQRKEELREFAEELKEVHQWLSEFESRLRKSGRKSNVWHDCRDFLKEYSTHESVTGEYPEAELSVFQFIDETQRKSIDNSGEFMYETDAGEMPTIALEFQAEDFHPTDQSYVFLNRLFSGGSKFIYQVDYIYDRNSEYLDEFCPQLLTEIELQIQGIVQNCVEEAFSHVPYPELQSDVESIDEWATWLIEEILLYDRIEEDLNELSELIADLEDTRKRALQTSYS